MKKIYISDYTLRMGTSGETPLSFKEKIEIARNLDKMHVDVIELAPIENEKTDVLLAKTILPFLKHSVIAVPAGSDEASLKVAYEAISGAENARLQVRIPTSPVQMEYFCHRKPAAVLELVTCSCCTECTSCTHNLYNIGFGECVHGGYFNVNYGLAGSCEDKLCIVIRVTGCKTECEL